MAKHKTSSHPGFDKMVHHGGKHPGFKAGAKKALEPPMPQAAPPPGPPMAGGPTSAPLPGNMPPEGC
jgi:hypothetical protein